MALSKDKVRYTVIMRKDDKDILAKEAELSGQKTLGEYLVVAAREKYQREKGMPKYAAPLKKI